jgi:hypothetical protein
MSGSACRRLASSGSASGSALRVDPRILVPALLLATAFAAPAGAFQFFDGRLQVNGFVEEQVRLDARNMQASDNWDLTQWYNILNVEIEGNIAPDGWGPFDLISSYMRIEARYDCIWTHGCQMFPEVNVYGDNPHRFPKRYIDARKSGLTGSVYTGDRRLIAGTPIDELNSSFQGVPHPGSQDPAYLWHVPGVDTLFGVPGADGVLGTADDPAFYVFQKFVRRGKEYRFGLRRVKGAEGGHDIGVLGPWEPRNKIDPMAIMADIANPFNPLDVNPTTGLPGSFALPYRPAPQIAAAQDNPGNRAEARGMFIPNEAVRHLYARGEFNSFAQNFTEDELAWNHGASQQSTGELKEGYLDLEMFDSRLWLRLGKQDIVWGKTELFRTTDQFNPQDLALASLPNLEESRIALFAARGVWSFYTVGPFDDVRLEGVVNFDHFQPDDLGRCGEPYAPNPVCDKSGGLFAHGLAGFGLAGEQRPPDPWTSLKGLEGGMRLEFRWNRFTFALTDSYTAQDLPYVKSVFFYERNVDPQTGWPRRGNTTGGCDPDGLYGGGTAACLQGGLDALYHSAANQQRFAVICGSSVGFSALDPSACAQTVFNSNRSALTGVPDAQPTLTAVLGMLMSGSQLGKSLVANPNFGSVTVFPTVLLNADPNDGPGQGPFAALPNSTDPTLAEVLTDQQEALLGCGRFFGTSCDTSTSAAFGGIDLLNSEMSVLIQSWPGFPGTSGDWDMRDTTKPQPGTVGFVGGAIARRFENGVVYTLPGARSPFPTVTQLDPNGWSASVDGCVTAASPGCGSAHELVQPFTGVHFQTELAAFSWNYLISLVALSTSDFTKPQVPCAVGQTDSTNCRLMDEFIPSDPFRTNGCSYAKPQLCSNIQALYAVAHVTRKEVRAGGNTVYGRPDFDWHIGGSGVLHYPRRNVLGLATDFVEDRTKSTWSLESTWIGGVPMQDNNELDGLRTADTFNLTVSVDRPTFVNFLNSDRTFFINTQWFFQYIDGWKKSFVQPGPFNVLATLHVDTGYYRDRLLPGVTFVYDFRSSSGAILPEIQYRFSQDFSVSVAASWFFGGFQTVTAPLRTVGDPPYRTGNLANKDWAEQGLSVLRDRDEVSLVLRYTF